MAAKTTKRRAAPRQKAPPAVFEVGSEEWKEEVRKARDRILGGRRADPDFSFEKLADCIEKHDAAAREGNRDECAKIRDWMTDFSGRGMSWNAVDENGKANGWDGAKLAVLQDIRRHLKTIIDRLPEKEPRV